MNVVKSVRIHIDRSAADAALPRLKDAVMNGLMTLEEAKAEIRNLVRVWSE
jgi:hypothetical protein